MNCGNSAAEEPPFRFDFYSEEENVHPDKSANKPAPLITVRDAKRMDLKQMMRDVKRAIAKAPIDTVHFSEHFSLKRVNGTYAQQQAMKRHKNLKLENTDLVAGEYEGGFKLWECATDMIKFLLDNKSQFNRVLEIGCGHGLPGNYCLQNGAIVQFQDYNEEVLHYLTVPNVIINDETGTSIERAEFLAGDWRNLINKDEPKVDLILTSDTIYSLASQPHLLAYIKSRLSTTGVAYIAAKTYYFGVGGSTLSFANLVKQDCELSWKSEKMFVDGNSNIREIASVRFVNHE